MKAFLLPVARPTFDVEKAEQNLQGAMSALIDAGFEVLGPKSLVMTEADIDAAAHVHLDVEAEVDVEILLMASFCDSTPATRLFARSDYHGNSNSKPVLLWSVPEPGESGERLLLNSMCGANLAAHALVHAGREVRHLHSQPSNDEAVLALSKLQGGQWPANPTPRLVTSADVDHERAVAALQWVSGKVIGAIGDAPPGFTPCYTPASSIIEDFGLQTTSESIPGFFERIRQVDVALQAEENQRALMEQPSLAAVPAGEAATVASVTVALEQFQEQNAVDAIALRCWPDFAVDLGACPCSALGRLSDRGTATACERDILGALNLLLLAGLGEEPTYLVDVVDVTPSEDLLRIWHCGAAATKLAVDPTNATQWIHCNRKLGVAGNFALKTGFVTLVRIDTVPGDPERLRMLLTSGESIPADNRFQGNTATLKVKNAVSVVNGLMVEGFPHHFAVAWSDLRPGLRGIAAAKDMELIEW